METMGEIAEKYSGCSSAMATTSSTAAVRWPWPMMVMVIRLVPMEEKLSFMAVVIPLPKPTITITAISPMMIPNMVRKVRNLLLQTFCSAWRKVS